MDVFSTQPSLQLSFQALPPLWQMREELIPQSRYRVLEGEQFNVYTQVNHVKAMKGARYDLNFDGSMIELVGVEEGSFLSESGPTLLLVDAPRQEGKTHRLEDQGIAILGQGAGVHGPGDVVRYLFEALQPGVAAIRLTKAILVDETRARKPFQLTFDHVEVIVASPEKPALQERDSR